MEHVFYSDGNSQRISWKIETSDSIVKQLRDHPEVYFDKVNSEQAKYIAFHVGMFWGIGTFIIKNEDSVKVMLDSKSMYEHLAHNAEVSDKFILTRTDFIKKLIVQRKLKVNYQYIEPSRNSATKLLQGHTGT